MPAALSDEDKHRAADDAVRAALPPGITLVRTLRGHTGYIGRIAWSPDGSLLASPSMDSTVRLWDAETGELRHILEGYREEVYSVAFSPDGNLLATGGNSNVRLWRLASGRCERTLEGHSKFVDSVAFAPSGRLLASGSVDTTVRIWEIPTGRCRHTFTGHMNWGRMVVFAPQDERLASVDGDVLHLWDGATGAPLWRRSADSMGLYDVAWSSAGQILATAGSDKTVKLHNAASGLVSLTLEGHTSFVRSVAFSDADCLLASNSNDGTVRLWRPDTGACLATLSELATSIWLPSIAFHPRLPRLAVVGSDPGTEEGKRDRIIHIYDIDVDLLYGTARPDSVPYVSAKVVLVGDSGVGKTGLGWRLAHKEYKEHPSTHGQQFWLVSELCPASAIGRHCETVLWDLAGQPDYRLTHALFTDDADVALVLFDPGKDQDPLGGAEYWLRQLTKGAAAARKVPVVLVAARSDRGQPRVTAEEMAAFIKSRGVEAYVVTSAAAGTGVEELIGEVQRLIPWATKPETVTTQTFARMKEYVLKLKEDPDRRRLTMTPVELRAALTATDAAWVFSDAELTTACGHLERHGFVKWLSCGGEGMRLLLAPEVLNNLAASYVLEARANKKGLGALEERRLLEDGYDFGELKGLDKDERDVLTTTAAGLFLDHAVCFRERDPQTGEAFLVFPELINLKRPLIPEEKPIEDSTAYTVSGAVENVYAALVVLLGYAGRFTRTGQWQNLARYEVHGGGVCGFRQEAERPGERDFVLYFSHDVPRAERMIFQGLFESILMKRDVKVQRLEPVRCEQGHPLHRAVVREMLNAGKAHTFCNDCGTKIALPKMDEPAPLKKEEAASVAEAARTAEERKRLEGVLLRLKDLAVDGKLKAPECFISYAWGVKEQEEWVHGQLATDLEKAGIGVVLDVWENAAPGKSVSRFVDRIAKVQRVLVVGTPKYLMKYENKEASGPYVVAAEWDLIGDRMCGSEEEKESVLPVLLEGDKKSALPPLMRPRVRADFTKSENYCDRLLDVLLALYALDPRDAIAAEMRAALRGRDRI